MPEPSAARQASCRGTGWWEAGNVMPLDRDGVLRSRGADFQLFPALARQKGYGFRASCRCRECRLASFLTLHSRFGWVAMTGLLAGFSLWVPTALRSGCS